MPRVAIPQNAVPLARTTDAKFQAANPGPSGLGEGLQSLGRGLDQAAKIQEKIDHDLAEAGSKTLDVSYAERATPIVTDFMTQRGLNAGNARPAAEKTLIDLRNEIEGKATTPLMRRMVGDVIRQREAGFLGQFASHTAQQTMQATDDASVARIGASSSLATITTDPTQRQQNIDTGLGEIASRGARLGWGEDQTHAEQQKFISGVHLGVVTRMLTGDDVDGAVQYRDTHAKDLLAGDSQRIEAMLHDPLQRRDTNAYVDRKMGIATGGDSSASFSYADPLHGAGKPPVPGGQFNAARDYGGHQGADIPAPMGTPVFATFEGKAKVTSSKLGGTIVTVDDGRGNVSRFMHLGKVNIKDGDTVTPDTQIGAVGMTGRSTGPHLHLEIMQDGKHVDPEKVVGTVRQSPQRHDLNSLLASVDADTSITPEQRDRYKAEIERRVGRDEQLNSRVEDDAMRKALDQIADLGGKKGGVGFTDMSQLSPEVRANLSPSTRLQLMTMAQENKKAAETGAKIKPDGPVAFNLNMLAVYQPEAFKAVDLRMYQNQVTPNELEGLAKTQAQMRVKPPETTDHSKMWGAITRGAPDLGLDLGADKGKPRKPQDRATAQRIFTMMQADLNAQTEGRRQPTDDEVQKSYDRAIRKVIVNGDRDNPVPAYDAIGTSPAAKVPDGDRVQIQSAFQRRFGRMPNEGEILSWYKRKSGQ